MTEFKKDDGTSKTMWKVFLADDSGAVGCVYSTKPYKAGDSVILGLSVNRDGRFTARIME